MVEQLTTFRKTFIHYIFFLLCCFWVFMWYGLFLLFYYCCLLFRCSRWSWNTFSKGLLLLLIWYFRGEMHSSQLEQCSAHTVQVRNR